MANKKFSKWYEKLMLECKNECPYFTCPPMDKGHICKLFINKLQRHIVDLRTKEEFMFELLDGRYRIRRLDKLNIVADKMAMKKLGKRDGVEYGGYEAYAQLGGYHGSVVDAIDAVYEDVLASEVGTEEELTTIDKLKKNLIKIKQQIIDEVQGIEDKIESLLEGKKGGKEKDDE